ncbi:hypothetical protein HETIRDRAFT_33336 [Heterobasidion irregulare TC 32-1]|uniref:Peroxin/Ferlin domain-containing protein n=1 Tax=Heterobasidion irregulare (strain TC 32-1) TaxID=747525 RepID=W4K513_HETIT|nr:uncharacterized protein HETIRDRAFT_33336 [Heterobasidion irregulare TC 32-1]ETW80460.1 hypothetical protein HETIRDRAFT_33336 [Heterobasidion irregulare TC 32-1]
MSSLHRRASSQSHVQLEPRSPTSDQASLATPAATLAGLPTLLEFVNIVPSPLTTLLVGLGPSASGARRIIEVISWKSSWEESWLAIAAWWSVCLFANFVLRYLSPVVILGIITLTRWKSRPSSPPVAPLLSEANLQLTISDFSTIFTLLPVVPNLPSTSSVILLRVCAFSYPPYLILTYFVRLRIILGVVGTVLLSWRAPWMCLLRANLWQSAWIRWSLYRVWSYISGLPLPARPLVLEIASQSSGSPVNTVRFLFTLYENHRWWMGLDWTAALLPGERPSWCSASQQPVSPPSAFTLPSPTIVYLPDGKGGRVKRVAMWGWEESEWKVVVRKEGEGSTRVERPLPLPKEETIVTSSGGRLFKAAGKMMEASSSVSAASSTGASTAPAKGSHEHMEVENGDQLDMDSVDTDGDGWVYGDNKWEGRSGKGGMGKYTRYRRWTRIAVLTELVEPVGPGELGIVREDGDLVPYKPPAAAIPKEHTVSTDDKPPSNSPEPASHDESRGLRQRLKAAVSGAH